MKLETFYGQAPNIHPELLWDVEKHARQLLDSNPQPHTFSGDWDKKTLQEIKQRVEFAKKKEHSTSTSFKNSLYNKMENWFFRQKLYKALEQHMETLPQQQRETFQAGDYELISYAVEPKNPLDDFKKEEQSEEESWVPKTKEVLFIQHEGISFQVTLEPKNLGDRLDFRAGIRELGTFTNLWTLLQKDEVTERVSVIFVGKKERGSIYKNKTHTELKQHWFSPVLEHKVRPHGTLSVFLEDLGEKKGSR